MKKKLLVFCIIIITFFCFDITSYADTIDAYVAGNSVIIRKKPTKQSDSLGKLNYGDNIKLTTGILIDEEGTSGVDVVCTDKWYQIEYNSINGYMCSTYVTIVKKTVETEDTTSAKTDYESSLKEAGFPSSYWEGLVALHEKYPNWVFVANRLNVEWDATLNAESVDGNSLTDGNIGMYDMGPESFNYLTDTFIPKELSTRFNASDKAISYYMDPRNWLIEKYIFQFEDLSYHTSYQTLEVVKETFTTSGNPDGVLKSHSEKYIAAANQVIDGISYSISPVHLATRTRQEVGMKNDRTQILGTSTAKYLDFTLTGYYNFFNIGAYADKNTTSPITRGLAYAAGPDCAVCGFSSTYGRPWNDPQKAINGGAQFLISRYFLRGQNTIYYQRFNVNSTKPFSNQYMTSIEAPASESTITYSSYREQNMLNEAIVFNIPVYINMPETASPRPTNGSQNNHLKSISINNTPINNFAHDTYSYDVVVANGTNNVNVSGEIINSKATISGNGTIDISQNKTINLSVTAENGDVQIYTLNFLYDDQVVLSPSEILNNTAVKNDGTIIHSISLGMNSTDLITLFNNASSTATVIIKDAAGNVKNNTTLATGDVVSITSNSENKEYPISVLGDPSGDGKVSIADLLKIQKQILGASSLSSVYLKSADINSDGSVTILDLLKVRKYILNVITSF